MKDQKTPECPAISDALLAYLDYLYPERSADNVMQQHGETMWRGGQTSVVRHLRMRQQDQIEEALKNKMKG